MISLQLIKLDNHYHLLDTGIPNRYYYDDFVKNIRSTNGAEYSKSEHIFPIIASTKKLGGQIPTPNIDFNQVSLLLSDNINYIQQLAELKYKKIKYYSELGNPQGSTQSHQIHQEEIKSFQREGFIEGYKQSIENNK